jgi:hypothetical protein
MDVYIIGLPLTTESISSEFADFFDSEEPTILICSSFVTKEKFESTNDYKLAKVGFDYLLNRGFQQCFVDQLITSKSLDQSVEENLPKVIDKILLCVNLWFSSTGRKDLEIVAKEIIHIVSIIKQKNSNIRIGIISEGSPYYADDRIKRVMEFIPSHKVINSISSADLSLAELYRLEEVSKLPVKIQENINVDFDENSVNVYSCLGLHYKKDITRLISTLNTKHIAYVIKVGHSKTVQKIGGITFKELLQSREYRMFLMDKTVIVYSLNK